MALFTRGISLWHHVDPMTNKPIVIEGAESNETWGVNIPGLQEVGELTAGASASAGFDKIEVTTLADVEHKYIDGLKADKGEAESISFTLLYDKDVYAAILALIKNEGNSARNTNLEYKGSEYFVAVPHEGTNGGLGDSSTFRIRGMSSIKVNSATVNGALTMALTISPSEEIEFTA